MTQSKNDAELLAPQLAPQVVLPEGCEIDRRRLAEKIVEARTIAERFAEAHQWSHHVQTPLFQAVELFSQQTHLFARICALEELPSDTPMPTAGLAAALEKGILLALLPKAYRALRPEYNRTRDAWQRLLAHELMHVLHLRLVGGNPDAMGPLWFFEGFAAFAADQSFGKTKSTPPASLDEAMALIAGPQRGSYARYKQVVAYLAQRIGLPQLIEMAAAGDLDRFGVQLIP